MREYDGYNHAEIWNYGYLQQQWIIHRKEVNDVYITETLEELAERKFDDMADNIKLLYHAIYKLYHPSHIEYIVQHTFGTEPIPAETLYIIQRIIQWKYISVYYNLGSLDYTGSVLLRDYAFTLLDTYAAYFGVKYKKGDAVLGLLRR